MLNPRYSTVLDYATFGHSIVTAHRVPRSGLSLTGVVVDMPRSNWFNLDLLEAGYERINVKTTDGETVFMYAG